MLHHIEAFWLWMPTVFRIRFAQHSKKSDQDKSIRMWIVNPFWVPNSKTPNYYLTKCKHIEFHEKKRNKEPNRDRADWLADPSIIIWILCIEIIRWIDGYYPFYVGVNHFFFLSLSLNFNFFCFSSEFQSHGTSSIALAGFFFSSYSIHIFIHFFLHLINYMCVCSTVFTL